MIRWLKSNHQALTAIGAMVVGLAALFIAWDQARVMRAQQHGSVVPALQIDAFTRTIENRLSVGLHVANNGVGPAFVRSVTVLEEGVPVTVIDGMLAAMPEDQLDRSWYTMTDRVIAPGETVTPISVEWYSADISTEMLSRFFVDWDRWDVEICYCSVFDRCWVATVQQQQRRPVQSCPVPGPDIFERYGSESFIMTETPDMSLPAGDEQ